MDNEVIGQVDPAFVREFADHILGTIPEEKVQVELRQLKIGRVMKAAGSVCVEELGQKIASIDPRLYFRLLHNHGPQEDWIDDLLKDNPSMCAPGYTPGRKDDRRHGVTFVGGTPIGAGPHSEKRL